MVDAIIVLAGGLYDDGRLPTITTKRIHLAIDLLNKGVSDQLIFSGKWTFIRAIEPPFTEAHAMKEYALSKGVPASKIILEQDSMDSLGNAYFCKQILIDKGWTDVILITSDYHKDRAQYVFKYIFGPKISVKIMTMPSGMPFFSHFKKEIIEIKMNLLMRLMLKPKERGNEGFIEELLFEKHPAYSDVTLSKRSILAMLF